MPAAATGANAAGGIVSGSYVSNYNGTNLGPVTIDKRTLSTNYNVLDNYMKAEENLVRGGFEWSLRPDVVIRNQLYYYTARREWYNNEVIAYNTGSGQLDRERFFVSHYQQLIGNLVRSGWSRNTIKPGDKVTANVHPLRDGTKGAALQKITLADTGQSFTYSIRDSDRPNIDQDYKK